MDPRLTKEEAEEAAETWRVEGSSRAGFKVPELQPRLEVMGSCTGKGNDGRYMCIYIYTYTHTHTYIYIYTYVHIDIYIYGYL